MTKFGKGDCRAEMGPCLNALLEWKPEQLRPLQCPCFLLPPFLLPQPSTPLDPGLGI